MIKSTIIFHDSIIKQNHASPRHRESVIISLMNPTSGFYFGFILLLFLLLQELQLRVQPQLPLKNGVNDVYGLLS